MVNYLKGIFRGAQERQAIALFVRRIKNLFVALLVVFSLIGPGDICAQTKPFSMESAAFLAEMSTFIMESDRKEGKKFMEEYFAPVWNGEYYNELQRFRIIEISNFMLKKRFTAFPNFRDYMTVVAAFPNSGRPAEEMDAWLNGFDQMIKSGRKQNVVDFLAVCYTLFEDNTLFKSASTQWRSRSNKFTFSFDSIPIVNFPKSDLVCMAKGDSSVILNTTGIYMPTKELWKGVGGKVDWERAGLKSTATYAEWSHPYEIKLKGSTFEIDTVQFTDPYFDQRLLGKLIDKVLANVDAENASYPRFEGYDRRIIIRNIAEGMDFEGGFSLQGAQLQGYGTKDEPAFLTMYRDKRPFIVTSGLFYSIEPERITSDDVEVYIKLDKDSIYHPSLSFRFLKDKKQLSLIRNDKGLSKAPFYDTYHKLDMYFEVITWKQGDPLLEMGNLSGSTQNKASFESFNYFKEKRYVGMLGIDAVHPLVRLNDFSKQNEGKFYAQEFAVFSKIPKEQITVLMMDMANKGFLKYDVETEWVETLPRLRQHILNSAKKQDYDVLQFNSDVTGSVNASLNLLNNDLTLTGVDRVFMSDSQDVKIFPSDKTLIIKKNRDFTFGGSIIAGRLQYFGKEYFFHYDPFTIDLLNVDSVAFMAQLFDQKPGEEVKLKPVKNVLEQVTGTLEIDAPSNKGGLKQKDYPAYPKFNSTKESYVYYDKGTIQRGVYDKEKFYYRSDPFQIDSLDNFTNDGLTFPGTLVSAGIFPDIKEPLKLQKDYALGFERGTGASGLPLYGKKAKFTATVSLNSRGLQGNGSMDYLTTSLTSKNLVFMPDSTIGRADTLNNRSATTPSKVPLVEAGDVFVRLTPTDDILRTEMLRKPMVMFGDQADIYGITDLSPTGMTGAGLIDFKNATLRSDQFEFETMLIHADTSDFRLTEGDTSSIAFRTENVNSTVNLDERIGEFVSNGDETKVEFPVNQYFCYMDRFKWFMDQGDIELESDRTVAAASEDLQLAGSNFISSRPDQDSLSFMAPKARYDLKRHLITATNVPYIQVADALITPDSSIVRIRKNAEMDPLKNSKVLANFVTKYHSIYDANIIIKAKRQYSGTGFLDYVDVNDKHFKIELRNINVDTAYQTNALGTVSKEQDFQLSPAFDFFGDVRLMASAKELNFQGSTRIQHGCEGLARNWMTFKGGIDPAEVFIPVSDTLYDDTGARIGAGIYLTKEDPFAMYGTFLSRTQDDKDKKVISAKGLLFYDQEKKEYMISNKEKIRQRQLPGDLVALAVDNCAVTGDGNVDLGVDLGRVQLNNVGTMRFDAQEGEASGNIVMAADFFFLDNALDRMAAEILAYPDQKPMDLSKTNYEKMLREVLGLERSDKIISELSLKGEIKKLPDELVKPIVLGDVRLKWNGPEQSWLSEGEIAVATILKKPVFRMVKGKVHLERKRSGDILTIYLALDDQTYYFFQYTRNFMYAFSSDVSFNTMIADIKDDKRTIDAKKDEAAYQFIVGTKRKVDDFRERFRL